ncbi:MAG TPA: VOC family protein [Candidatus Angelobacter sp.]
MPFQKITPNLMVHDVTSSLKFYEQVLGLQRRLTVPDREPYVFVSLVAGEVEIFLNQDQSGAKPQAGGMSLYMELQGLDQLLDRVQQHGTKIEVPLNETFYGMREFAVLDPDGYMIIFAEPVKR